MKDRHVPDHALDYLTLIARYAGAEDEQSRRRWGKAMNQHIVERGRRLLATAQVATLPVQATA